MTILKLLPSGAFIPVKSDTEVGHRIGVTWYLANEGNLHVILAEVLPLLSLPDEAGEVPTFVVIETLVVYESIPPEDLEARDNLPQLPVWVISWHTDKTEDEV